MISTKENWNVGAHEVKPVWMNIDHVGLVGVWSVQSYRATELLLRRWQGRSLCPNQCLRLCMQPLFKLLPKWLDFLKTFLFCRHWHLQASSASCLHLLFIQLPAEIRRCNQPFLFIGSSEAARWFQDLESQWKACEVEKGQSVKWLIKTWNWKICLLAISDFDPGGWWSNRRRRYERVWRSQFNLNTSCETGGRGRKGKKVITCHPWRIKFERGKE